MPVSVMKVEMILCTDPDIFLSHRNGASSILSRWPGFFNRIRKSITSVLISSERGGRYTSKHGGLTAESQASAEEISADQLDGLLVPGGWAPDKLRRDKNVLELVKEMDMQGKILGFICHAGWVAASAKICNGKRVTGSTGIKDDMENAGAIWVDEAAFREGNLVWGRVVADIPDYCRELVKALSD